MIRRATQEDAIWIAEIWNDVIENTQITFTTTPKTVDAITSMISDRVVLVLPDKSGFASYGPFRSGPGYAASVEHTIHLAPHARGRGQGSALLLALEQCARDEGRHVMIAGIGGKNTAALAFHAAAGFTKVAQMPEVGRKNGEWLDLILMQKRLGATASANASGGNRV